MTAPLGGAVASCTATMVWFPLGKGSNGMVTETGIAVWLGIVKVPVADQAVTAAVVGAASPCAELTRQNFWPEVRERAVMLVPVIWLSRSSTVAKPESFAISMV